MTRLHLLSVPLLLAAACSRPMPVPSIEVRDAWARATAPGQSSGAIYVTLVNAGEEGDRLVGASTPRAAIAMLHKNAMMNGIVRMQTLDAVSIPPETTVALPPGGAHIMLHGLTAPLVAGEPMAVTFRFEKSGNKTVTATVVAPAAR